ncbi:hypothetical protein [Bathymodiolus platifrons methanotrophic gill symbiont]|uniref:hypothetical protein n=1 Tax=Bathymodiolus platifrons methanotrophic gill symbiont TaxID=113268 RepID=UPI001124E72A|nr:hypothetical protein [Bathymodiolus platifrons methanotrophic gill symbiont]
MCCVCLNNLSITKKTRQHRVCHFFQDKGNWPASAVLNYIQILKNILQYCVICLIIYLPDSGFHHTHNASIQNFIRPASTSLPEWWGS